MSEKPTVEIEQVPAWAVTLTKEVQGLRTVVDTFAAEQIGVVTRLSKLEGWKEAAAPRLDTHSIQVKAETAANASQTAEIAAERKAREALAEELRRNTEATNAAIAEAEAAKTAAAAAEKRAAAAESEATDAKTAAESVKGALTKKDADGKPLKMIVYEDLKGNPWVNRIAVAFAVLVLAMLGYATLRVTTMSDQVKHVEQKVESK